MENITIQISFKDADYERALAKALRENDNRFTVSRGKFNQQEKKDIYITEYGESEYKNSIFLVEKESMVDREKNCFYKYENIKSLIKEILASYTNFSGLPVIYTTEEDLTIVGVISSSGGRGCSSIAMGICQEAVRFMGKNALYISLEEFESTRKFFKSTLRDEKNYDIEDSMDEKAEKSSNKKYGITEYLYYLRQKKPVAIDSFLWKDQYGVLAFNPGLGKNPLREMNEDSFVQFIDSIVKSKVAQIIVFDIGNNINEATLYALKMSKSIAFAKGEKDSVYLNYLEKKDGNNIFEKIIEIENKYEVSEIYKEGDTLSAKDKKEEPMHMKTEIRHRKEELENRKTEVKHCVEIPRDDFALSEGEISLDSDFGNGIKELAERMKLS